MKKTIIKSAAMNFLHEHIFWLSIFQKFLKCATGKWTWRSLHFMIEFPSEFSCSLTEI